MFRIIMPIAFMFCVTTLSAQSKEGDIRELKDAKSGVTIQAGNPGISDEEVFSYVEQMSEFTGDLVQYLRANIKSPRDKKGKVITGRVMVKFIIKKDGSVSDVKIAKSTDQALDAESLRVVKYMPKWKPGKSGGQTVAVFYNLPIKYSE